MVIENKFDIGDIVYLVTDPDQIRRIITGITIRPTGILYEVSLGATDSDHYDFELSLEPNIVIKTSS